jgi:hypothetical protein
MIINFEMKKISGGEAAFIIILFYAFTYIANWDI